MKAVVLAAGEGRRLKPMTNTRPKPMIPVANRPILEHVVEALASAGIDELVLVVGYKRNRIQTYFGDGDDWGVDIAYAVQEKQLGTGHAVACAEDHVDDAFLVLNGDRIVGSETVASLAAVDGYGIAVTRTDQPSDYGVVALDDDRVERLVEKPPAHEAAGDVVNAGVYALDTDVFDEIDRTEPNGLGEVQLTTTLDGMLDRDVRAVWADDDLRDDVSFLWDLLTVNADVVDEGVERHGRVHATADVSDATAVGRDATVGANATVKAGTALGDNASVGANAVVANAVVLSDATIGDGTVVRDAVIGENALLGPGSTVVGGSGDVVVDDELYRDVRLGAVVGDNATIGGGAVLAPGTVVGDGAAVEAGVRLADDVAPDAQVRRG